MSELIFAAWNRGWYLNLTHPGLRGRLGLTLDSVNCCNANSCKFGNIFC